MFRFIKNVCARPGIDRAYRRATERSRGAPAAAARAHACAAPPTPRSATTGARPSRARFTTTHHLAPRTWRWTARPLLSLRLANGRHHYTRLVIAQGSQGDVTDRMRTPFQCRSGYIQSLFITRRTLYSGCTPIRIIRRVQVRTEMNGDCDLAEYYI